MDTDRQRKRYAALCIFARKATKGGDAVIDALPFAVDEVKRRRKPRGRLAPRVFNRTSAILKAPVDASSTHAQAIDALRERLASHASALHGLRDNIRIVLAVVDKEVVRPWRVRFSPETIDWLSQIGACLMFDAACAAPAGTEIGGLCAFCGIVRPLPDEDALIGLLRWTSPRLGTAEARLVARSLDARASEAIARNNCWFLFQPRDGLTVLVKPLRQVDDDHGGAVAVSALLAEIRANRPVRRALRTGSPGSIDIAVTHWTDSAAPRSLLTGRDVRRMADIGAALSYELVPDLKPQFSEHGECVHCDYVQPRV